MSSPCKIDPTNKDQRRDAAISLAGRMEIDGTTSYAKFVSNAVRDYGESIRPYLRDMHDEAMVYYQTRAASPLVRQLTKLPGGVQLANAAARAFQIHDAAVDGVRRVIAPQNRSPEALLVGNRLREEFSIAARRYDISERELARFRSTVENMTQDQQFGYIDAVESGNRGSLSPELQQMAAVFDEAIKQRRELIENLSPGSTETWNEQYFPGYWDIPPDALDPSFLNRGKPLAGTQGFRREKVFTSHADGRALGWRPPKGSNVQDYMLWKLQEMDRFIAAHETVKWLRENDYEMVVNEAAIPKGWKRLNDRMSQITVRNEEGEPRATGAVRVYPEKVADLINNHLDPGLRGNPVFRGYMTLANIMNQFRLGLSAFHASFVTGDTAISELANAIEAGTGALGAATHGRVEQAGQLATVAGKSALKMFGLSIPAAIEGSKIRANWFDPLTHPEMAPIVQFLNMAGGRAQMDSFYHTKMIQGLKRGFREAGLTNDPSVAAKLYGKTLAKYGLPSMAEAAMWPIMNWYIPRLKMGIFAEMARTALAKLPPEATRAETQAELAKVWDSVDNRLGQMIYDNLHLNRTAKDASMASVMAVGWQVGILREAFGAGRDTATFVKDFLTPGSEAQVSRRMAYAAALPLFVWTTNAILQATLTSLNSPDGKAEWPKDARDYNEPRTGLLDENGSPQRFMWPNYWTKEVYRVADPLSQGHLGRAVDELGRMASHKLNSPIHPIFELMSNQDYFGGEIFSADEPLAAAMGFGNPGQTVETWKELGLFSAKQFIPFSFVAQKRVAESGGGMVGAVGSFFGVQPLPLSRDRSPLEDALIELRNAREPKGQKTQKERLQFEAVSKLRRQYRQAEEAGDKERLAQVEQTITELFTQGVINNTDIGKIRSGFNVERVVRLFDGLANDNVAKALALASSLASPKELQVLYPGLLKARGSIKRMAATEDEKVVLEQKLDRLLEKIDPDGEKFQELIKQEEEQK